MDKIKDRCLRMLSLGKDNNNIPKIGVLDAFLRKNKKTSKVSYHWLPDVSNQFEFLPSLYKVTIICCSIDINNGNQLEC